MPGVFSLGYLLFGVPSTVFLHWLGVRRWIGLTLCILGLCSAATALVRRPEELYLVRLLLGAAQAGLGPGTILVFSNWFPIEYRGRVFGSFFTIGPVALIIGGPVSSTLLSWGDRYTLAGWQWLFIVEAAPTFLVAVAVLLLLTDAPSTAPWLSPAERLWLEGRLPQADSPVKFRWGASVVKTFSDRRVWALAIAYFGIDAAGAGVIFFLPVMIHSMGFSVLTTGFVVVLPAAAAALSLPLWGLWADRRRAHATVAALASCLVTCGLAASAVALPSPWALAWLGLAMIGFYGFLPGFWALSSSMLQGTNAGAGVALISTMGTLGAFVGAPILGRLSDMTQTYGVGLFAVGAFAACAAVVLTVNRNLDGNTRQRKVAADQGAA